MRDLEKKLRLFFLLTLTVCYQASFSQGDASISNAAGPSNIVITTYQRYAGAIGSITWNGKEFIDSKDHGRLLQTATTFNNWGECYNPTEAGSQKDFTGPTSSSILRYLSTAGNCLETNIQPCFWVPPGETTNTCGLAKNTTVVSDHIFTKRVSIGLPGMPHVVKYDVDIWVPEHYTSFSWEVLTGYLADEFTSFWNYDPATQSLTSVPTLGGHGAEGDLPEILSTPDHNYAMGIYCSDRTSNSNGRYWGPRYNKVGGTDAQGIQNKWNCIFRSQDSGAYGNYQFHCYLIIGTLNDVTSSMTQLYNFIKGYASFSGLNESYCANSGTVTLTPVNPGGTFSGPGISGNTFNPSLAGPGRHIINYTVTQGSGCTAIQTISSQAVIVNSTATITTNKGWDIGVYNPNNDGDWFIRRGDGTGGFANQTEWSWGPFGNANAQMFSGDFNGDGFYDVGAYNPNNDGNWFIRYGDGSGNFPTQTAWNWGPFGNAKNQVFAGDFNGDGKWDVGMYNPNDDGNWFIRYGDGSGNFPPQTAWKWGPFANTAAQVFAGDFNGDGEWDVGVYNANSDGNWLIRYGDGSGNFSNQTVWNWGPFGNPDNRVFTGDFNSDGKWDVGMYNPNSDGNWFIRYGDGTGNFPIQTAYNWGPYANVGARVFSGDFLNRRKLNAEFNGLKPGYCVNAAATTLSPVNTGGVFAGNGISNSTFNPFAASTGTHNITHTITKNTGCTTCSVTTTHSTTVYAIPVMTSASALSINSGDTVNLNFTSNVPASYAWIASDNSNITGESLTAQNSTTLTDKLVNTSTTSQTVTYTVTPSPNSGVCNGTPQVIKITVAPSTITTIDVKSNMEFTFDVVPNPNNGRQMSLMVNAPANEQMILSVRNVLGKVLFTQKLTTNMEGKNIFPLQLNEKLVEGMYIFTIVLEDTQAFNRKVVVDIK
jgi:hypothetical protein